MNWVKSSGLMVFAAVLAMSQAGWAADHAYVGSNKCRKCHMKEFKSWQESAMAKSFEVLKPGVRRDWHTT